MASFFHVLPLIFVLFFQFLQLYATSILPQRVYSRVLRRRRQTSRQIAQERARQPRLRSTLQ